MDFSITEVESNAALVAGSAGLALVAALMVEQAKIKDLEKQLVDHGFATYECDKLPSIIETSGAWSVNVVALWKRIKSSHKAAVVDGFATATNLRCGVQKVQDVMLAEVQGRCRSGAGRCRGSAPSAPQQA